MVITVGFTDAVIEVNNFDIEPKALDYGTTQGYIIQYKVELFSIYSFTENIVYRKLKIYHGIITKISSTSEMQNKFDFRICK